MIQEQTWTLIDNPAWADIAPSGFTESECHDRSHFVTIVCKCGEQMHVHETQLPGRAVGVVMRCKACGEPLICEPGVLHGVFAELRQQGWIR